MGRGYGGACYATRVIWYDAAHGLGFFMRHRIRDRGLSSRLGRNGPNWILTPLSSPPAGHPSALGLRARGEVFLTIAQTALFRESTV